MSPSPDFHAMAARRIHSLPDAWEPRIYEVIGNADAMERFRLTGSVPIGVVSRGPRKGKPKWPPRNRLQEVIITRSDVDAARTEWVNSTNLCAECGGDGRVAWQLSSANGIKYRQCKACNGTGKAAIKRVQP